MVTGPRLIFDKYELVRRLAVGGMGEVFVARQVSQVSRFERHVILKSLLPDLAGDPAFVEQFLDEARVAATLNHPNVVSVFEVGVSHGTYYLAMEFIPGMNLSQLRRAAVQRAMPISPAHVARMLAEAAAGLHHAHFARDVKGEPLKLVHRDISPQNIMVRSDGVTKVVDFGIASATNRVTRTRTGTVKGKLAYMSPEQLTALPIDGRSDQFALGIVFWELLTRTRLFTGDNDLTIARAVLQAPIEPPSKWGCPAELDAVVMTMLNRDPAARFPSCEAAGQAIEAWLKTQQEPSDHASLAAYLQQVAADELSDANLNTPDDFVLKLHGASGDPPIVTAELIADVDVVTASNRRPASPAAPRSRGAVLLSGVVVLGVAATGAWFATRPEPTVIAPPPPVAVAVILDAGAPAVETPVAAVPVEASLSIASRPAHARLQVDGRWVGETPQTLQVAAHLKHRVHLELDGFSTVDLDVPAPDAGTVVELDVPLVRAPRRTAKPQAEKSVPAFLSLRTEPPAVVFLDGERIGSGTLFRYPTTSGEHLLEFEVTGRPRTQHKVTLKPNTNKFTLDLDNL